MCFIQKLKKVLFDSAWIEENDSDSLVSFDLLLIWDQQYQHGYELWHNSEQFYKKNTFFKSHQCLVWNWIKYSDRNFKYDLLLRYLLHQFEFLGSIIKVEQFQYNHLVMLSLMGWNKIFKMEFQKKIDG